MYNGINTEKPILSQQAISILIREIITILIIIKGTLNCLAKKETRIGINQ